MAEYSTQTSSTPQVSYLTTDHLGSTRLITDQLGAVKDRKDYGAFGDETATAARVSALGYTTDEPTRKGYTGYEKDAESSLEFAQARYYSTTHGRYTSVDPLTASASIRNPQTFNRYTYVLNSPYKYTDPLGLIPFGAGGSCAQWCPNSGGWTDGSEFRGQDDPMDWAREYYGSVDGYTLSQPDGSTVVEDLRSNFAFVFAPRTVATNRDGLPSFDTLWAYHKGKDPTYVDPVTGEAPKNFEHQCAINFSYALQMAGVDMSDYTGKTVSTTIMGKTMKLATDVYALAAWVIGWYNNTVVPSGGGAYGYNNRNYSGGADWRPEGNADPSLVANFTLQNGKLKRGIIITVDHWYNDGQLRGHIDLWNGGTMRRAGSAAADYISYSKYVWFLPFQ